MPEPFLISRLGAKPLEAKAFLIGRSRRGAKAFREFLAGAPRRLCTLYAEAESLPHPPTC